MSVMKKIFVQLSVPLCKNKHNLFCSRVSQTVTPTLTVSINCSLDIKTTQDEAKTVCWTKFPCLASARITALKVDIEKMVQRNTKHWLLSQGNVMSLLSIMKKLFRYFSANLDRA